MPEESSAECEGQAAPITVRDVPRVFDVHRLTTEEIRLLTRGYASVNQLSFAIMVNVVAMLLVPLAVPGSAIFLVALVTAGFGAVYFWRGTRQEQQLAKRMFDDAGRRHQRIHNSR